MDHIVVREEQGGITLPGAILEEETSLSSIEALGHRAWNNPVVADDLLLLRIDPETIAFEL